MAHPRGGGGTSGADLSFAKSHEKIDKYASFYRVLTCDK